MRIGLGLGGPLVAALVWTTLRAPGAPLELHDPLHLLLELVFFGSAALSLGHAGRPGPAWCLAVLAASNRGLMYVGVSGGHRRCDPGVGGSGPGPRHACGILRAALLMPCLLCDPASEPRASGAAPICATHRQQARSAFEAAEPLLRAHLERAHGTELDAWARQDALPGLTWHLWARQPHVPGGTGHPPWPGRMLRLGREPDAVLHLLQELLVGALTRAAPPDQASALLRVGTPDGSWTASVDPATARQGWQAVMAQLVTLDRLEAALASLPLEPAARAIDACLDGQTEAAELVSALGALSDGAQTLALIRGVPVGDSMLVDPVEVADQARVGSGEFTYGWWAIRASLAEPARGWVELLEGRFPRARRP